MTKKTCVIIGVVISLLTILAFLGVPILGTDFMGSIGVPDTDFEGGWGFATGAYIGNVILMAVSCILIYNNNVKTVDILYPIAIVLSFISLFVSIYEINTNLGQWKDQTIIFIVILLVMALVQVVTLICYYSSKTLPRRKNIINIVPLKKVPGGLLLAWGLRVYFALGVIGPFIFDMIYSFQVFRVPSYIQTWCNYVVSAAIVVYILGIWRASFYRPDRKIKGSAQVVTGLSITVCLNILSFFAYYIFHNDVIWVFTISFYFLYCIAWIVCAIGFIHIGKTGHCGYLGKHGVNFLVAAAWIYASCSFVLGIVSSVWRGITFHNLMCIITLFQLLYIICFILQWKGWRYLLSSWYGESDPELPVMSVVVPGTVGVQEEREEQL